MSAALAIFVKTPGLSPVKTRLATTLGTQRAIEFHRLAAAATAAVARQCQPELIPYWAVAEADPATRRTWLDFAHLWQGTGELGDRLHHVYRELQARHGHVLLIGADAPQLTPTLLRQALHALDQAENAFVLGPASDGGFWSFGGREPVDARVWRGVHYSRTDTAVQLRSALAEHGQIATLPALTDVDDSGDLPVLAKALTALPKPLPEQDALLQWLHSLPVSVTATGNDA